MKAALSFILLAAVAGALIGITRFSTYQTIENNEKSARAAIISQMLPRQPDPEAHDRLCASEVRGYAGTIRFLVLPGTYRDTRHRRLHRDKKGQLDSRLQRPNALCRF